MSQMMLGSRGMNHLVAGVGVGGNGIKVGLVGSDGSIVGGADRYISIQEEERTPACVTERLALAIVELQKDYGAKIDAVGIGFPGSLDSKGVLIRSPNLPEFKGMSLVRLFSGALGSSAGVERVFVANDANAYAMGERRFGAGKNLAGVDNLIVYTLGTGVGGGIITGGKLFIGDRGFAGELGHVKLSTDPAIQGTCGCGGRGCLEQVCGNLGFKTMLSSGLLGSFGEGLMQLANSNVDLLMPARIAEWAEQGNQSARNAWNIYGRLLGSGIAGTLEVLAIDNIVLGGGISRSFDLFIQGVREGLADELPESMVQGIVVHKGMIDDRHAEIIGAAALASAGMAEG